MSRQTPLQTLGFTTRFFFPCGKKSQRLSSNGEVETKKTLPDGSTAKISERTVKRGSDSAHSVGNVLWLTVKLIGYQGSSNFMGSWGSYKVSKVQSDYKVGMQKHVSKLIKADGWRHID